MSKTIPWAPHYVTDDATLTDYLAALATEYVHEIDTIDDVAPIEGAEVEYALRASEIIRTTLEKATWEASYAARHGASDAQLAIFVKTLIAPIEAAIDRRNAR